MSGRYLTDLADVIHAAGLPLVQYQGWQTRARSSGGYASGRPTHIMCHHTASSSSWDGQRDADYIATGDSDAPLANLYLERSGTVWLIAAGATNTNGKGHDWWGGGVPDNSMNSYAIGIEAGNNGTGEQWPAVQQDTYLELVEALRSAYSIPLGHVRGHFEWTSRKIDPAGNSRWAAGGASWDMDAFRQACADTSSSSSGGSGGITPVPPPIPEEGESMLSVFAMCQNQSGVFAVYTGGYKVWLYSAEVCDAARGLARLSGVDDTIQTYDETMFRALGPCVGPPPAGYDEWGVKP